MSVFTHRSYPDEALSRVTSRGLDSESSAGVLRVYFGAAVGVGKTYAMLDEADRLASRGADVAIGVVETHGRQELVHRMQSSSVAVPLTNDSAVLDVNAILERRPEWVLVDGLAHKNLPGSQSPFRWQEVHGLLDAGINVLSTVNVEHLESLTDVVRNIIGVAQNEILPDWVLRGATQIELVDLSPDLVRQRLAAGWILSAREINAEKANYFRPGTLTALRELALLWLADRVDEDLRNYKDAHHIRDSWEARERVVVALPGGPEGELLIRRAARIAARSGRGVLCAVHAVEGSDIREAHRANLLSQAQLVESLGGTYSRINGRRRADDLVEFARSVNATQLVIGDTPHGRLHTLVRGPGVGHAIIRASGDIDVHTVTLHQ